MIVFNLDLDNTLIYSYKHDIGVDKICVELYQNRRISYISKKTFELLKLVFNEVVIVPTSTRTIEQYNRIDLGIGLFPYALVCNGGILLINGKRYDVWYQDSLELILSSKIQLDRAMELLEYDARRKFELRFIENLFIFTKCNQPEKVVEYLKEKLDTKYVDVFNNGEKVYIIPVALNKGEAIKRFRKFINADIVIAAGDSEFDISMLNAADFAFAPYGFKDKYNIEFDVKESDKNELFSENLLKESLKIVRH